MHQTFIFCDCEGMSDGLHVSLYLVLILCNVDRDYDVPFAGDQRFVKELPVFLSEKR